MLERLLIVAVIGALALGPAHAQKPPTAATSAARIGEASAPVGAAARHLLGRPVKNAQNETIGEIKSVYLDADGTVDGIIVGVGGFLGVGEREVMLPWRGLRFDPADDTVRADMTREQLKAQPAYAFKDQALRGTIFTDRGVWVPERAGSHAESTGEFNVAGQMSARALLGKTVKTASDETVGKIDDIYLDASGAVKEVVVSVGGVLGVGSKRVAVPWSDLKIGRDGTAITVSTTWTKESLKAMPDYKEELRQPSRAPRSGG